MKAPVTRWVRVRIGVVAAVLGLGFVGLVSRAWQLQVRAGAELRELAEDQYLREIELTPKRGLILDRELGELAGNEDVDSIYANPRAVRDPGGTATALAQRVRGLQRKPLARKLASGRRHAWVKRHVTAAEAEAVKQLAPAGVHFVTEARRRYPHGQLAAHVLGFAGFDQKGLEGLEKRYDAQLRGQKLMREGFRDALGRYVFTDGLVPAATFEGDRVVLTLDRTLQFAAERELAAAVQKYDAAGGTVIVLAVDTGEVLALANAPTFDPNAPQDSPMAARRNRALTDAFEPGSTMKAMVVAAALEEGVVTPETKIDCEQGRMAIGGHRIHDHTPHAAISVSDVLKYSSNIGAAKIGKKLGKGTLYRYLKDFGIGDRTGIDLTGEAVGIFALPGAWSEIQLATVSFGQGVSTTALQMAVAMAALANGGKVMKPYVVSKVLGPEGELVTERRPEVVRQVVKPEVARAVATMLQNVAEEQGGTGQLARVPGYRVAGKTGTAQKVDPVTGGYGDKRVASFIGFAPADAPRVVIAVVVDEPSNEVYGGVVAAPVFSAVAAEAMRRLGVPATEVTLETTQTAGRAESARAQGARAEGGDVSVEWGDSAVPVDAAVDAAVDANGVAATGAEDGRPRVPRFVGKTLRQVLRAAQADGVRVDVTGTGIAYEQTPIAGAVRERAQIVKVAFAPREEALARLLPVTEGNGNVAANGVGRAAVPPARPASGGAAAKALPDAAGAIERRGATEARHEDAEGVDAPDEADDEADDTNDTAVEDGADAFADCARGGAGEAACRGGRATRGAGRAAERGQGNGPRERTDETAAAGEAAPARTADEARDDAARARAFEAVERALGLPTQPPAPEAGGGAARAGQRSEEGTR